MGKLDLGQAEFLFHADGLPDAALHVYRFTGHEALNQAFVFTIELVSAEAALDLDASIGQPATLTLQGRQPDGERYTRYVHGVVERFVQTAAGIHQSRYEATLVPSIKSQHYTRDSRIFQQMSAPDVTRKVLKDAGIADDAVNALLHGSYDARDYCVQYQESNLGFVARLWEEEGISYHFEHEKDKDILVLGDGGHAFSELPHYAEISHRDHPHVYEETLFELRAESAMHSGATAMRDFKFKQPGLELEATERGDTFEKLRSYYFPGEYVEPALGKRLAKIRLEEQNARKNFFAGRSNVRALCPGYSFTLSGHRRTDCNQEYLILAVHHQGSQPLALGEHNAGVEKSAYENRIECIPNKITFRPARVTPRPCIPGVQTAIVVGPSGEEIHCDSHGRVKVQFHWDQQGKKDDQSSCWIRVSQPWGGVSFGGIFLPRIGQEVLVQFLEGDPDRPVVSGRVYNGDNPLPYPLPDMKTISTFKTSSSPGGNGYNELRFEDAAGKEEIFMHGQLDMNTVIERDRTQKFGRDTADSVGRDSTATVAHDRTRHVGNDESITVGHDQTLAVGANRRTSIASNKSTTVGGSHTENIAGTMTVSVMGSLTETVMVNYAETVGAAMELTVGGGFAETVGAVKALTVGGALVESIGASHNESVGGSLSIDVGGSASLHSAKEVSLESAKDMALQSGKALSSKASKTITIDAGTKLNIVAADEIALKTGSATIVMKKNGDITIKGNKITVKGSGDVVVKGSKIAQN